MSARTLEPWRKVENLDDFDTLITPSGLSIDWEPPYFYLGHGTGNMGRPKHVGFVTSLQFAYLRRQIKAGRVWVARLIAPALPAAPPPQ